MRITVLLLCLGITGCLGPNVHSPDSFEDGTTLCGPTGCIAAHDRCLGPPDDWMAGYHPTMWDPLTQGDAMAMPWIDPMAPEEIVPYPATHDAVMAPQEEDFDLDAMAPDVDRPNRLRPTNRLPHIAESQQNEPSTATTTPQPETWPVAMGADPKTTQRTSHDRKTLPYDEVFGPADESDERTIAGRSDHELSGPELAVSWDEAAESGQPAVSPQLDGLLNEQNVPVDGTDNFGGAPPVARPSDVHRPAVDSAVREERETMVLSPPLNTVPADALRHANYRRTEAPPHNMAGAPSRIVTTAAVVDHVGQGPQRDQHFETRDRSVKQPTEQQMAGASPAGNRPAKTEGHPPAPRPNEILDGAVLGPARNGFAEEVAASRLAAPDVELAPRTRSTSVPQTIILSALGRTMTWDGRPVDVPPDKGENRWRFDDEAESEEMPSRPITGRFERPDMEADEDISTTAASEEIEASATPGRTDAPPSSADRQQRLLTAIGQMIGESGEEATAF